MAEPTILVCEDDPVIQRLLQVNFGMEGWTVLIAADGAEGLEAARRQRPDCIVSDLMMPKMSGLELLEAIRADDDLASLPFIVLSAKAQASDVAVGMELGADAYVTKPFEPLDLIDKITELLAE